VHTGAFKPTVDENTTAGVENRPIPWYTVSEERPEKRVKFQKEAIAVKKNVVITEYTDRIVSRSPRIG